MKETKYTPGPWNCIKYAGNIYILDNVLPGQKRILDSDSIGMDIAFANGILAAHAPLLMQQLKIMSAIIHANLDILPKIAFHQHEKSIELINKALKPFGA